MLHKINKSISTILLLVSLFNVIFIPTTSSYSFLIGVLDCNNLNPLMGCRHEIGHRMDHDLGVPSESYEFGNALQIYMLAEFNKDAPSELAEFLIIYPGVFVHVNSPASTAKEVYAAIYAWSDGDLSKIPDTLRRFYSSDRSYLDLYECLAKPGLNVCDRSISRIS